MREIFIKELNQWQIVVKQFNYIGMFDDLAKGREKVAELFGGAKWKQYWE